MFTSDTAQAYIQLEDFPHLLNNFWRAYFSVHDPAEFAHPYPDWEAFEFDFDTVPECDHDLLIFDGFFKHGVTNAKVIVDFTQSHDLTHAEFADEHWQTIFKINHPQWPSMDGPT